MGNQTLSCWLKPMTSFQNSAFKKELHVFEGISPRKFLCEFGGAFALVYFSNWSYISYRLGNESSAAYGLSLGILYFVLHQCGKNISGGVYSPCFMLALLMNKTVKLSMFGIYFAGYLLASIMATQAISYTIPGAIESKLEKEKTPHGVPTISRESGTVVNLISVFLFSFILVLIYLYATVDREVDSDPSGAFLGSTVTAMTCCSARVLGGVYNPIRIMGGMF